MQTFELLIVFAALMAVIALVAIAIDWVGRPLRNRRFIPRIYRYDDEVAPDVAFSSASAGPAIAAAPMMAPPVAGPPIVMQPPVVATIPAQLAPRPPDADAQSTPHPDSVAAAVQQTTTRSAFSDSLDHQALVMPEDDGSNDGAHGTGSLGGARPRGIAETIPVASADSWNPAMALDARVGERKATVAVKAERFWKAAAAHLSSASHFDEHDEQRMAEGKAPRRRNPRTGDLESMELIGLRSASKRTDVRMKWPDDAVDPWSAS